MSVLVSVVAMGALVAPQDVKTYRDDALGLTFQHPAAWKIKKEKYSTDFSFQAGDGSEVLLQVLRTQFHQAADVWQGLQRDVTHQMNRRMAAQWEETILGVPLLLSRIEYNDGSKDMTILVGLLYTRTGEKLNFRLNSTRAAALAAESVWRQALMTLRTTSGQLPLPEDPNAKPVNTSSSGQAFTTIPADGSTGPVRTKNSVRVSKLGVQVDIYLPEGWSLEERDQKTVLMLDSLRGSVELKLLSGSRVNVPLILRNANSESFSRYKVVTLRDDPVPGVAKSGSYVASTLRVGTDAEGKEVVSWHMVGTLETIVWRVDYTCGASADLKADQKAMERLRDLLAVEIVR